MEETKVDEPSNPADEVPLRTRSKRKKESHDRSVAALLGRLHTGGTSASEEALQRAAAHDLVLMEGLEETEVAVVQQLGPLAGAGSHKNAPVLARVLSDLSKVRSEAVQRATALLKSAEELAARRELLEAEKSAVRPLRRVV